jgi:nucleotide-binding universal stress UspA family protein
MKILVPVDGSEFSRRMLAWLSANDDWLAAGHSYTIVHVAVRVPARAAAALERQMLKGYYEEQAERIFKPIRRYFAKKPLDVSFRGVVGHPGEVIAETAEKENFDLVLMGSHGHGALLNMVLGSVATQVLARCKVPVLLIR